jgi:hypothetical protein
MRPILAGIVLAFVAGCGSEGTGPDSDPVASVVISVAPTAPVLVGATVQLGATALNATGGTIPGAVITWQTSDALLATVSTGGLVTALGAGSVTITAKSGNKTATATLDLRSGASIGVAGGSLPVPGGGFTMTVPAGALPQTVDFLVRPVPDPAGNPRVVPGTIFELTPASMIFGAPATLTIRYESSRIPAGVVEQSLQLYVLVGGAWTLVSANTVNLTAKTVTSFIYVTGTYAIAGTGVASVVLSGPALDGALYPGQTGQLVATVLDDLVRPLSGIPVVWTSSDQTRATVAGGTVTAVATGSVTITAQANGKSAVTTLAIVARPVADWSQATTEWSTHQGNPEHTGFVAATVDPVIFSLKWTTNPFGTGVALNPATFGPGAVFVSSATYFGVQKLATLDLVNGAPKWIKDFGGIHGVHPPAYGNGSVYVTTSGHQDSFLWAFDPATGALRFQSPYGNQWSTYYAPVVMGQRVYMAGGTYDGMYSFDATAGTQAWFVSTAQYSQWTPAVRNGVVYAYTGSTGAEVVAVDAQGGGLLYQIADPHFSWNGWSMNTASVLGAQQDLLATQNGRLISFDLGTHTVRWELQSQFRGDVTTAGDLLYVINDNKLEVRREDTGALVWSWTAPLSAPLQKTMLVTRNLLFASTATSTYAIDLGARRQVWSWPAGGHLALSPQGVLLIAGADGSVTAITVR